MFPLSGLLLFVRRTTSEAANEAVKCVLANSYEVTSLAYTSKIHQYFKHSIMGNNGKTESQAALERDSEHITHPAFKAA